MDYQKLMEFRNTCNPFMKLLGITVEEISLGYSRIKKTVTADDLNPLGRAHGGLFFSIADNACGVAMASYGYVAVTLNASYNFLKGANVGDVLTAEGRVVKYGKTVSVCDATIQNQDGVLLGNGSFTFFSTGEELQL